MKRKKIILIVVAFLIFLILAPKLFVLIRHYQGYCFIKDFPPKVYKNPKYIIIVQWESKNKILDEIKVNNEEDISTLWNSIIFYEMVGYLRKQVCAYNNHIGKYEFTVFYPGKISPLEYSIDVFSDNKIGYLHSIRTYKIYDMPNYTLEVKKLYKKYINNKSFVVRNDLKKFEARERKIKEQIRKEQLKK